MGRATLSLGLLLATALSAGPASAQDEPIGPCSPYRAADGDVPSEMPGCARRLRPAPGSLADELAFRRARKGVAEDEEAVPDDGSPPSAGRKTRTRRP